MEKIYNVVTIVSDSVTGLQGIYIDDLLYESEYDFDLHSILELLVGKDWSLADEMFVDLEEYGLTEMYEHLSDYSKHW